MATVNQGHGGGDPTHFVVELISEDGPPRYALCQTLTVVPAGSESLPAGVMEEFMSQDTLRAVAVPEGDGESAHPAAAHWTQLAANFQSGHEPV
jgi:hypothetical protein